MRRPERPLDQQRAAVHQPRGTVDARRLERLLEGHVGQDRGHTARHERLARTGRADHDDVVPAGRGDLQRALGALLPLDKAEIDRGRALAQQLFIGRRLEPLYRPFARQVLEGLLQRRDGIDVDPRYAAHLAGVRGRYEDAVHAAALQRADDHGQHAAHRLHRAIQRQFAQHGRAFQRVGIQPAARRQYADGQRQIVGRAFLLLIGRREIDGHPPVRIGKAAVLERRAHALARFLHRRVGQADQLELSKPAREIDLHAHGIAVDPVQTIAEHNRKHTIPPLFQRLYESINSYTS